MDYDYAGIRRARRAVGITQEELAAQLGINRATVSKYESGTIDLSLGQLQKIARILHTSVYEMVNPDWGSIDTSDSFADDKEIQKKFSKDCSNVDPQKKRLEKVYNQLNADGQRVATDAVELIAEIPRYRRTETTPQPPATPPAGTDTTPGAKPAEGPQEGE